MASLIDHFLLAQVVLCALILLFLTLFSIYGPGKGETALLLLRQEVMSHIGILWPVIWMWIVIHRLLVADLSAMSIDNILISRAVKVIFEEGFRGRVHLVWEGLNVLIVEVSCFDNRSFIIFVYIYKRCSRFCMNIFRSSF